MQRILLEIVGTQRIDDESDKIELTTTGTIEETDNAFVIRYKEEQEPPMAPVSVTVIVKKRLNEAEITRQGGAGSCLTMKKSGRVQCHYGTEFGSILMGITTHTIEADIADCQGFIYLAYDIDISGSLVSMNDIKLTFRKIQEK